MMALTVLLSGAAPPAGALVTLSSNSAAFPVPGSVTVLAGTTGTSLLVEAATVKSSTLVTVTASYNKVSVTAGITLAPAGIPTLAALAVTPSTVRGGSDVTITVTLSGPAPTGGAAITFTSNNAAFPLPASAAMAAGMASGSLQVQTKAVSASTTATITVSSGGTTRTAVVTITP